MSLLVKGRREGRDIVTVTPQSAGWNYVGFSAHRLDAGEHHEFETGGDEACIVVLRGIVSVATSDAVFAEFGKRDSVFEDESPWAVFVSRDERVTVTAHTSVEIGIARAPASTKRPARLLDPNNMHLSIRGDGANTRYVCDILPQTEPADSLLVVEVRTPAGHSSSYPPHKHDTDSVPEESSLEETYYHRLDPAQGFAFQRVYTDDRSLDESMAVENHDVVMVPRGYHPVVVPYGYQSYYLNVMAGPKREWCFRNDPAHEWMLHK